MNAVGWTFFALLLAAGMGAAVPAHVSLTFPDLPPIAPGAERTVAGNLTYSYDGPADNRTNLSLALVAGPAWLTARVDPAMIQANASDPAGQTTFEVHLTVGVRAGTPALQQHSVQILAQAGENPPLESAINTAGLVVRSAFVGNLRVDASPPETPARPGDPAILPVRVVNHGNGPAKVTLSLPPVKGLTLVPPSPVIVEAGQERFVNVSVLPQQAGTYPLVVRYTSAYAFDGALPGDGGEATATLEVRSSGIPGPDAVGPLLGAALLLAAAQRRRA